MVCLKRKLSETLPYKKIKQAVSDEHQYLFELFRQLDGLKPEPVHDRDRGSSVNVDVDALQVENGAVVLLGGAFEVSLPIKLVSGVFELLGGLQLGLDFLGHVGVDSSRLLTVMGERPRSEPLTRTSR